MFKGRLNQEEILHLCRRLEIELILQKIATEERSIDRILEIGSGDGFQIDCLRRLGRVFPSDIATEQISKWIPDRFVCCSVERLPYMDCSFDFIFSSNVLEHVADKPRTLRELKRVATAKALLVHVMPTPVWKVMADLSYYPSAAISLAQRIKHRTANSPVRQTLPFDEGVQHRRRWFSYLIPPVHGTSPSHWDEYRDFRSVTWVRLFRDAGFERVRKEPLFTYSPPAIPVVSPNRWLAEHGLASCIAYFVYQA